MVRPNFLKAVFFQQFQFLCNLHMGVECLVAIDEYSDADIQQIGNPSNLGYPVKYTLNFPGMFNHFHIA